MLFELLSAMVINPDVDKLNLVADANVQTKTLTQQVAEKKATRQSLTQAFVFPEDNPTKIFYYEEIEKRYEKHAKDVVEDFSKRKDNPDEFLKWVDLPAEQLKKDGKNISHLDEIYEQAYTLKSRKNKVERPLVVLGIGGSKHTAEFLLNLYGVGNKGKVYFYSDIDPISFKNFLEEVKLPVQDLNFLVVSKSGTTFETKDSFIRFENMLVDYYKKSGLKESKAKSEAQKHFAICTDKKSTEKNLRGKIGLKNGKNNHYIKELYIHDGVGGRFSMFDDAGLFAIAYAGVEQNSAKKMLESADNVSKKCLRSRILENPAMRSVAFSRFAEDFGYKIKQQQFFGRMFENGGENWIKQLYYESLKDFNFNATKAPDSMHYASEGFFFPENRNKYHVVMTVLAPEISENYEKYVLAILKSYSEKSPMIMEILDVENGAVKPESIGTYVQTKHFETVYLGMMRRDKLLSKKTKLPEILQPNVEVYKNKFKPQSLYELTPGQ